MPSELDRPEDVDDRRALTLVTKSILDTHIRDNLLFLKSDPVISETTVTTTTTGAVTVATLSGIAIPADVGAVYVEAWAISFGITSASGNPSAATATLSETTAGTVGTSTYQNSDFGTDAWGPFYMRSRDQSWANSTRTVTLTMTQSLGTARLEASTASPIVLRIVRSY